MYCYKCGKTLHDESKFCAYCGEKTIGPLTKEKDDTKIPTIRSEGSFTPSPNAASSFTKESVNYFIGLVLYIIGVAGCFKNYKKMTSLEEMFFCYFDMGACFSRCLCLGSIY